MGEGSTTRDRLRLRCAAAVFALGVLTPHAAARAEGPYKKVQPVLTTSRTVLDEPLAHADGSPLTVSSMIVTIDPGEETAWHKHGVPVYIYVLSGAVTVDYGDQGTRAFGAGGSFMEAMDVWHRGTNRGAEPVRILAVYLGSDTARNVIPRE